MKLARSLPKKCLIQISIKIEYIIPISLDSRLRGNDRVSDRGVCDAFIFAGKLIIMSGAH
jgi:hypothetical protein